MTTTCLLFWMFSFAFASGKVFNIEEQGAVSGNKSLTTCINNTGVFNRTLWALNPGDTLLVPKNKIFWFIGGIYAKNLSDITIQIDGSIYYTNDMEAWPRDNNGHVKECMLFQQMHGITFTSTNGKEEKGLIFGNGNRWWGAVEYLIDQENRPRLLHIDNSENILIEYIYFKDSPYWNVLLEDVSNVEIQYSNVSARRTKYDDHDMYDLTAFNTDGFDVAGENVYIHDCEIWNDDDCVCVKRMNTGSKHGNCSRNWLVERINASGLGLTIGSIGPSTLHTCVDNITFRDIYMYKTVKGIYMKSDPGSPNEDGVIKNILYENIIIDKPTQYAIWIGPQQAIYSGCCELTWPQNPRAKCPVPFEITWENITLRNITVNDPQKSAGTVDNPYFSVVLGNNTNPMKNITFDHVVITGFGNKSYACDGVIQGMSIHGTYPIPSCFNQTNKTQK